MVGQHSVSFRFVCAVICSAFLSVAAIHAADFSGIGYLSPDDNISRVSALSRDGSSVVGVSYRFFSFDFPGGTQYFYTHQRAFIQDSSGKRSLETPPYQNYFGWDTVWDVAPGGSAAFYRSHSSRQYINGAIFGADADSGDLIWTPNGSSTVEPNIRANVFAGDANTYAGKKTLSGQFSSETSHAFRRTPQGGIQDLGWLRPSHGPADAVYENGAATGISVDGNVVVGTNSAQSINGPVLLGFPEGFPISPPFSGSEAFSWTPDRGMVGLGYLPNTTISSANGVSGDGKVVFGTSSDYSNTTGFRWTEVTGMTPIAGLIEGQTAIISAANFDGSLMVGSSEYLLHLASPVLFSSDESQVNIYSSAVIWDQTHGLRDLKAVLESDYGLDLAGWQLLSAIDISDDGRTIIGNGVNPQGNDEGWIVHLDPVAVPEPAAWMLLTVGACIAPFLRRKGQQ
jgi:hypothetical protein